jgi:putative SOS response-associated peptidase YedK
MCGKFTAMASWREVVEYSRAFSSSPSDFESGAGRDEEVTYGVAKMLPVIIWDREVNKRRLVPMRWGLAKQMPPRQNKERNG